MQIPTPRGSLLAKCLAVFFFLQNCFSMQALASQTGKEKVTIVASNVTLDNVFKQIEKQTGLRFVYAVETLNVNEKVTVDFRQSILDNVLTTLLSNRDIVWQYRERTISLRQQIVAKPANIISIEMQVKDLFTLTGKVTDAKGSPVPGATVMVKGTKKGTKTDGDGEFVLTNIKEGTWLLITCIGFETKEFPVAEKNITVRMNEVIGRLGETVIVGYGTTTQRFNTGNVSTVKAADIEKQPVSDPLLTLQGRVPGMIVTQTTGVVGGQVKVQIRGQNSILSSTNPLFIIDGVPYQSSLAEMPLSNNFGAAGNAISALNFINPSDIESIDVLKDADATAIYGSRGANGVILITTKKGVVGPTRVNVTVTSGSQNLEKKLKLLNTSQYLEMRREAFKNDGVEPSTLPYDQGYAPDLLLWDTTRYTNWQKIMLGGTGHYTDAHASVSGGSSTIRYMLGGDYHKETTMFPGDLGSQRGGAHFNISGASPNQRLKTALTGSYTVAQTNLPRGDFVNNLRLAPDAPPIYNADGTLNWADGTWTNPYSTLVSSLREGKTNNMVTNIDISYRLIPGLILKANLGYNELRNSTFSGDKIVGQDPKTFHPTASAIYTDSKSGSWISEPQVTYARTIWKGNLNILGGATLLGTIQEGRRTEADGIPRDALIRNLDAASSISASSRYSNYKYAAFFGRVGYNLLDKYVLNLTLRRDGSSRFGPQRQYATFGAIGAAWIFSQENFIKSDIPFLSYGKLRGSYGTTGNDGIGDYQYLDNYQFQVQPYQGAKGLQAVGLYNPYVAWERTRKMEVGLETGFFKDRIMLAASYYINRSGNQLMTIPLPSMTGGTGVVGNLPAEIRNSGLELVLSSKNIQTRDFSWSTDFNMTVSRNKLLSFPGDAYPYYAKVGRALSVKDLSKVVGVDPATGAYIFIDTEGKPATSNFSTPAIAATSVDVAPVYYGGINNSFHYKGFQLDVFLQYVKQRGLRGDFYADDIPGVQSNQPVGVLDRWRKVGDVASHQRFSANSDLFADYSTWESSDKAYTDASFIRCKNVAFFWQIPDSWKRKMHINSTRIYVQGQNLFTITRYPGWDPETQSLDIIPPLRVLTAGIQLTL